LNHFFIGIRIYGAEAHLRASTAPSDPNIERLILYLAHHQND